MPDFVSFNEFVDRTAAAKVEHHRENIAAGLRSPSSAAAGHRPGAARALTGPKIKDDMIESEFAKMKDYVLTRYAKIKGVETKDTFLNTDGSFVDCVPTDEQPAIRAAKEAGYDIPDAPPAPTMAAATPAKAKALAGFRPLVSGMLPPLRRGLVDAFGKPMACPEDRVPLRRITISQMAQLGSFDRFFRKYPVPAAKGRKPAAGRAVKPRGKGGARKAAGTVSNAVFPFAGTVGQSEIHRHAVCQTSGGGNFFGCSTWLNIWQVDSSPGVFNLSQLWILGQTSGGRMQTIESGWQNYPGFWGTNAPALFVFYNPNGYDPATSGYGTNPQHLGFIQKSSDWVLGAAMPPPYSSPDGDQRGYQMQWEIDAQGTWWLYMGTGETPPEAIGCFPGGLYQGGTLARSAQTIQFGGEVCSQPPGQAGYPNTGKMGSGLKPFAEAADSFREVCFHKQIRVKQQSNGSMTAADIQVPPFNPRDSDYAASVGSSADWGSFLFFGGQRG